LTFLRWKVNLENEVLPSCPVGNARHSHTDYIYQHPPRFISIERRYDFGTLRQPGDGRLEQARLVGIGFAGQAGILGLVLGIREQRGMGQGINGAFG
jgi:hypothetical protein